MKIATSAYPLDFFDSWAAYEDKMDKWVSEAAGNGAELLVFPEYGAMELATLAGTNVAADLEASLFAVSDRMEDANKVLGKLAAEYNVHILGPSGPVAMPDSRPVNRAYFFSPDGKVDHQDKQIMTMFERDPWDVTGGGPLKVFETRLGKFGVLISSAAPFRTSTSCWFPPAPRRSPATGASASARWRGRSRTSVFPSCPRSTARPRGPKRSRPASGLAASMARPIPAFRRTV